MIPEVIATTQENSCLLFKCPYALPALTALLGLFVGVVIGKFCHKHRPGSHDVKRMTRYAHPDNGCVEIYVGNLSYDMTEDQMRKEFEKYGKVSMARVIANRFQKSKGFGFVEMPNRPEAEAAIKALNEKEILGRKLRVNEAKNKSRE